MLKTFRPALAVFTALLLSISGVGYAWADSTNSSNSGEEYAIIDHGHIDIFHASSTDASNLVLQMGDDTAGTRVYRTPESAILQVNPERWLSPDKMGPFAEVTHNQPAAVLPLTQDNNSLWPGWDVMEIKSSSYKQADIVFDEVIGPEGGQLFLVGGAPGFGNNYQDYMQYSPNASQTKFQVLAGKHIHDENLSHTHVFWAFTKPGIYQFKAHMRASTSKQMTQSSCVKTRVATYSWRVLDKDGNLPQSLKMVSYGQPIVDNTCKESTDKSKHKIIGTQTAPSKEQLLGSSSFTEAELKALYNRLDNLTKDINKLNKQLEDCRIGVSCGVVNSGSGNSASSNTPKTLAANQRSRSASMGNAAAGMHIIPYNTHVHPNWVFTAPGRYKVVIRQTARLKSGKIVTADTPLNFIVGGAGNANQGHYDIGADVKNGEFYAVVRDDSRAPARYVSPSSLTFGLGSAAKETAPAGIGFIASAGSTIYRIPEVQKSGVPWVGANTMNPGVLNNVAGGVTWSLASFSGPGEMALFSGGGFNGNYQVWLNTRGIKKGGGSAAGAGATAATTLNGSAPTGSDPAAATGANGEAANKSLFGGKDGIFGLAKLGEGSAVSWMAAGGIFMAGLVILAAAVVMLRSRFK